jgi:predicted acetyltransferase
MRKGDGEVRLRPAGKEDARALAELWAGAFPGEPRIERRLESLLEEEGPHGGLSTCHVAEMEGRFVGGLRHYPLEMSLHGVSYPTQGLAAVAVAPECRRMGIGRRMCVEALRMGRESGCLLSTLFPFRSDFYARLGYTLVGELHRYRFNTAGLPPFGGREEVGSLSEERGPGLLADFYSRMLPRTHGLIHRTAAMWRDRLSGRKMVYGVYRDDGSLSGYLIATGSRERSPERHTLQVNELLAGDTDSYRALLGWLSAQRDQWPYIRHDALPGEHFHQLLPHPRTPGRAMARGLWFPSAFLLRGPMMRILDVDGTLEHAGIEPDTDTRGIPIRILTELFLSGALPGQAEQLESWDPAMGIRDFRLLDVF